MNTQFLHREPGNVWLIIIFDGWSARPEWLADKQWPSGFDVLRCSDYDDFDFDLDLIKRYRAIHLYAWSLGIFAASRTLRGVNLTTAYALCGTETPVSATTGIPPNVFRGTREGLDERNLHKFRRRMFSDAASFAKVESMSADAADDIENLKRQLSAVEEKASTAETSDINWTLAVIGSEDRIFPPEAQLQAWRGRTRVIETSSSHFIDIHSFIGQTLIDAENVGKQFGRSLTTYEENAGPQRKIAEHLAEILNRSNPLRGGRMLEIGPGTGMLTRFVVPILKPSTGVFVDVCQLPQSGLLEQEYRFQADACRWIITQPDAEYDYVVSSSAIQWVNDLEDFLRECRRVLKRDGILCVSTFGPGTLAELDVLGHGTLRYHSVDEIRNILETQFDNVAVEEGCMQIRFNTAREALMHIKRTGVTAAGRFGNNHNAGIASMLPRNADGSYTLTYRPIYIHATNKA